MEVCVAFMLVLCSILIQYALSSFLHSYITATVCLFFEPYALSYSI